MTRYLASMYRLLRRMQSISLEVEAGDQRGTYASLLLDFEEGTHIVAGVPLERGREVSLEPGTPVRILVVQVDGIHVLESRVVGPSASGPGLQLAWPAEPQIIQRRSHPRVEILVRAHVAVRVDDSGAERTVPALVQNLSVSGVLFALPDPLEGDRQVRIALHLPGIGEVESEARVVRGGEDSAGRHGNRYWAACEFVGMLESVRKDLTLFILEVQREQPRSGAA